VKGRYLDRVTTESQHWNAGGDLVDKDDIAWNSTE